MRRLIGILSIVLALTSCGNNWTSSVPSYPVHIEIKTWIFTSAGTNASVTIVNKDGFFFPAGQWDAVREDTRYGYGGVAIVTDASGKSAAYDMCCPHCMNRNKPITMDSYGLGICPTCGEQYDTFNSFDAGTGFPTKGISKEGLRRYPVRVYNTISGEVISVNN